MAVLALLALLAVSPPQTNTLQNSAANQLLTSLLLTNSPPADFNTDLLFTMMRQGQNRVRPC